MKLYQLFEDSIQGLFEIDMSPSGLAAAVKNIDARVGMEFEMIVPNVAGGDDDDPEMIMDMDEDRDARGIWDIVDFFNDSDYNSRNDVRRLEIQLKSEFSDWLNETFESRWEADKETFVYDYVKDHMDVEDVAELLELNPDSLNSLTRTLAERAADLIIAEGGDRLDNIREQALEEFMSGDDDLEGEWLGEMGLVTMSDVHNAYSGTIAWPYWTTEESDSGASIDAIADDFSQAIGRPVNASERYHGARREPGKYVVEPDGSLNPDDSEDMGLEFVSPPLTVSEMLEDLEKVRQWAQRVGAYTNKSTGLHMNVSIPGYNDKGLDFVKLALLVGDQYVLDQFGRSANTYATSALSKIQDRAKKLSPDQVQGLFDQMRSGLNKFASRSIQGSDVGKYTSIHPQGKYIEFRSPGGDWLDEDPKTLVSTMMRFIVALDAAMDPDKYRKEYLSKLGKLLTPKSEDDPIDYFVKYSAGELPKQALKSFLRQAQLKRSGAKKAMPDQVSQQRPQLTAPETQPDANWAVVMRTSGRPVNYFTRNTPAEAQTEFDLITGGNNWTYVLVPVQPRSSFRPPRSLDILQGSSQDLQQQRSQAGFTGYWKITIDGEEVHRFGGVGNVQQDAVRFATRWLLDQQRAGNITIGDSAEIDVLPVMSVSPIN
jgi:hypothetical protein